MTVAVYGATLDVLTNGHWWMIEQGMLLADHLHIAVAENPAKTPCFTIDERCGMIRECLDHYLIPPSRVSIGVVVNEYLVSYARRLNANYLLRGLRSQGDFDYERAMRNVNADIDREIVTVFLMPPREIVEVSSSLVKSLIGPEGWDEVVRRYVPSPVFHRLLEKYRGSRCNPG
jgi:pantetheine-phosphate adenylyltransferase